MEKASEVYLHSKRNDAMDNENIILSLSDKIIEGFKSKENQHYFFTVSSLDETSDISKREQFHISEIYLDWKGAKQERFLKSREDRPEPFSFSQWKN